MRTNDDRGKDERNGGEEEQGRETERTGDRRDLRIGKH